MAWQSTPYTVPLLLSAGLSGFLTVIAWRRRNELGALPFAVVMFIVTEWTFSYALRLAASDLGTKLLFEKLGIVGGVFVPVAWFVFALEYTGRDGLLTRRTIALLSSVPAITTVLAFSPAFDPLIVADSRLMTVERGFVAIQISYGQWYLVNLAYSYVLTAAGTLLFVRMFITASRVHRLQAGLLVLGALAPLSMNILTTFGPNPYPHLDLTPFALAFTGVVIAVALFRYQLLDVEPIVRDALVELMDDAVIVLDAQRRVVDVNPAGRRILGSHERRIVGQPIERVLEERSELLDAIQRHNRTPVRTVAAEIPVELPEATRYFHVRVSPLRDHQGRLTGSLLVLRDVTERREHEQRLEVMNRVLRHNIRNDMNVVLGHTEFLMDSIDDETVRQRLATIHEKSQQVVSVSEKARDAAQALENIRSEPTDLDDLLERAVAAVRREHPEAEIDVSLGDIDDTAAEGSVYYAIHELIENAVAHGDREQPRVSVSASSSAAGAGIRITDDGPGIPPVEQGVIQQGEESPLSHGSGLGLWIARWIVSRAGGELRFDENEPRGSVVTIWLPPVGPAEHMDRAGVDLAIEE